MDELAILGEYRLAFRQRMMHDNGVDAALQEQTLGGMPVLFAEQWAHVEKHGAGPYPPWEPQLPPGPPPFSFLLLVGRVREGSFRSVNYVENDGAKPVDTTDGERRWRFFLAERVIDLRDCRDDVRGLPVGQPVPLDQIPAALLERPSGVAPTQQQMQQFPQS